MEVKDGSPRKLKKRKCFVSTGQNVEPMNTHAWSHVTRGRLPSFRGGTTRQDGRKAEKKTKNAVPDNIKKWTNLIMIEVKWIAMNTRTDLEAFRKALLYTKSLCFLKQYIS